MSAALALMGAMVATPLAAQGTPDAPRQVAQGMPRLTVASLPSPLAPSRASR
jgi:hypothetical protein